MISARGWPSGRRGLEPDAHARRCASDAVDVIDAALLELHGIRARLIDEIGNTLTILAEQRVAHGVADPWALRLVGAAPGDQDGRQARSLSSPGRVVTLRARATRCPVRTRRGLRGTPGAWSRYADTPPGRPPRTPPPHMRRSGRFLCRNWVAKGCPCKSLPALATQRHPLSMPCSMPVSRPESGHAA